MKYIRTKDGIYEVYSTCENGININNKPIKINNKTNLYVHNFIKKESIVDEADTIEELCDGFIGLSTKSYPNRPDIEPNIYYFNKPFEFEYGNNRYDHLKLLDVELKNQNGWTHPTEQWFKTCDIYGFVRTSKGLIYVAKMNEKGELELL